MSQAGFLNYLTSQNPLSPAQGGTGVSNPTAHAVAVAEGASPFNFVGPGAAGSIFQANGATLDPTWTTATYPNTTTINQLLYSSSANTVAGLATVNDSILSTNATGIPTWLSLTDGQIIIGSTIGAPLAANITAGTGISVTNGHNSISIGVSSAVPLTFNADSGSATASGGAIKISGGSSGLTTTGAASTINIAGQLALLHGGTGAALAASNGGIFYSTASAGAILSGTATANQVLMSGSSTTPSWSTATYPATTTANYVLYSSATNVVGQISTGNNQALSTNGSGVPSFGSTLTIGSGAVGAPTYSFSASTNTGIYYTSSGNVNVASNGNQITQTGGGGLEVLNGYLKFDSGFVVHQRTVAISTTMTTSDYIIGVSSNASPRTITLPNGPNTGQVFIIKDVAGTAQSANNITVSGNGANIDGAATQVINTNYGSMAVYFDGSNFWII